MLKKVTSYQTSDGKAFTDKLDAAIHQTALDFRAKMLEEYAPVFTSAPDAKRMLSILVNDPENVLALLEPYAKQLRKLQKRMNPAKEYDHVPAVAA